MDWLWLLLELLLLLLLHWLLLLHINRHLLDDDLGLLLLLLDIYYFLLSLLLLLARNDLNIFLNVSVSHVAVRTTALSASEMVSLGGELIFEKHILLRLGILAHRHELLFLLLAETAAASEDLLFVGSEDLLGLLLEGASI